MITDKESDHLERQASTAVDADSAVETAMTIVHQLTDLASNPGDLTAGRQIFDLLNARMFLGFHAVNPKKRVINKIKAGVVTFGDASPPIEIYEGPTARSEIKKRPGDDKRHRALCE